MADKEVKYSFTGDVSSLQSAAEQALNLLTQIEAKFKTTDEAGDFGKNKRATKTFQANLQSLKTTVTDVQAKLQALGGTKLPTASVEALQFTKNVSDMQSALTSMDARTKYTTADVKALTASLKNTNSSFQSSEARLNEYVSAEERFGQVLQRVRTTSENAGNSIKAVGNKISASAGSISSAVRNTLSTPFVAVTAVVQSFKDKAAASIDKVKRVIEAAGSIFRVFKGDTEAAASAQSVLTNGTDKVEESINKENKAVSENAKELAKAAASGKWYNIALSAIKVVIGHALSIMKKFTNSLKSVGNFLGKLISKADLTTIATKNLIKTFSGAAIGKALGKATLAVSNFIANLNLFNIAVGSAKEEASSFVKTMANMYGLNLSDLYRSVGYFSELTTAIGATDKAASVMSLSLTKAAADIASLYNVDIEQVQQNLAMGIEGMSRSVRKYGIDIQRATLQETALQYGITQKVSAMSEASRQALRYITIINQVRDSTSQVVRGTDGATQTMGDFARMIEAPANQLKVLKAQLTQLATAIGSLLIPVLQRALPIINGFVMAVRTLLQVLATLLRIDMTGFGKASNGAADSIAAIGDAAGGAADKMKKLIAPFDELNILSEDQGGGGGSGLGDDLVDPQIANLLDNIALKLDNVRMKALDVRDAILKAFGIEVDSEGNATTVVGGFVDNLKSLWANADYSGFGSAIADFINKGISWAVENLTPEKLGPKLKYIVDVVALTLNGFFKNIDAQGIGITIANLFNTALETVDEWFTTFDFTQLGTSLGELLNGIINNVNWVLLGKTLGDRFTAAIDTLNGLFSTFDWASLGQGLASGLMSIFTSIDWTTLGTTFATNFNRIVSTLSNFLSTYKWGTLGKNLATGLSNAIRTLDWAHLGDTIGKTARMLLHEAIQFVVNMDWFALGKGISEALLNIDWFDLLLDVALLAIDILVSAFKFIAGEVSARFEFIGDKIQQGFKDGIVNGFKRIGKWLKEHVVDPVVNNIKDLFGIHSPSTVMKDIGGYLVEGLKSAFDNLWDTIKQPFVDVYEGVVGIFNDIVEGIKIPINAILGAIETMVNGIVRGMNNMINALNGIAFTTPDWLPFGMGGKDFSLNIPTIREVSIPKLAAGGVVNRPTRALIGEGSYPEAVIPLGNSPQFAEMLDKIADKVGTVNTQSNSPVEVRVFIGGKEWDQFTYESAQRGKKLTGAQPIQVGG